MSAKRFPLDLPAGMVAAGTTLQSEGRWFDGQLIRFLGKDKMPVGGWRRMVDAAGVAIAAVDPEDAGGDAAAGGSLGGNGGGGGGDGVVRGTLAWRTTGGVTRLAFGTVRPGGDQGLFVVRNGQLFDITPAGADMPTDGSVHTTLGSTSSPAVGATTPPIGLVRLSDQNDALSTGAVAFATAIASGNAKQTAVVWFRMLDMQLTAVEGDEGSREMALLEHAAGYASGRFLTWKAYFDDPDAPSPPYGGGLFHWLCINGPGGGFISAVFDMTGLVSTDPKVWHKVTLVYDGTLSAGSRFVAYISKKTSGAYPDDVAIPPFVGSPFGTIPATGGFPDIKKFGGYLNNFYEDNEGHKEMDLAEVRLYKDTALTLAQVKAEDIDADPAVAATHRFRFNGTLADTGTSPATGALEGNAALTGL